MTRSAADVLADLAAMRATDPPTHGGRILAYVYDSGRPDLDDLAERAATAFLPVNGLDPTTFRSVAALESALVGRARALFHGDDDVVGSVTSGGTESCLLAVKVARELWRAADPARAHARAAIVLPTTAHPAFHKAAQYLDLDVMAVPVSVTSGQASTASLLAALDELGERAALVVVSARATRSASSTRWQRSPRGPLLEASRATSTPASADGCSRGGASSTPGTSPCRA